MWAIFSMKRDQLTYDDYSGMEFITIQTSFLPPTIKTLKETQTTDPNQWPALSFLLPHPDY